MKYYFHETPGWLKKIYPDFEWKVSTPDKDLYLTFDDGPVPQATDFVLDSLERFNAKATFFVVGENVKKHPELLREVIVGGHSVGNHTYNHLSGWTTGLKKYLKNIHKCHSELEKHIRMEPKPMFRPPYGRIGLRQSGVISKEYRIVMWDMLSGDFDSSLNIRYASEKLSKTTPGSIIVFHDSLRYLKNVKKLLPIFLKEFTEKGFRFKALSNHHAN